jgi:glucokinase
VVGGVGVVLGFQREPVALPVCAAAAAHERALEQVARVELQAGLGRPDDQSAAAAVAGHALDQLAVVLTNALLAVNPERVIIGGGLATAGDLLLEPLRQRIAALLMTSLPDFVVSELGPDAALAGAITYASHVALERLAAELDTVPAPGAAF